MGDERFERLYALAERFADERDELAEQLAMTHRALSVLVVSALRQTNTQPVLDELRKLSDELGGPKVVYEGQPARGRIDSPRPYPRRARRSHSRRTMRSR